MLDKDRWEEAFINRCCAWWPLRRAIGLSEDVMGTEVTERVKDMKSFKGDYLPQDPKVRWDFCIIFSYSSNLRSQSAATSTNPRFGISGGTLLGGDN